MRWSRSSLLVFAAALLASLSIHLPVYEMLGVLARAWEQETASRERTPPSQIEFEMADTPEEKAEPEPELKEQEKRAEAEKSAKRPEPKPEKAQPKPEQKKPEPPKPDLPKPELVVTPPPQPTKPIENKLAVTQKTDDPNVPPPENSRFIAEENRRVEEEMIASVRSLTENDEQPNASAPKPEDDQLGNSKEEKAAELQNVKGEDSRIPDKREAKEKPLSPSQMGHGDKQSEAVAHAPERGGSPSKNDAPREVAAGSERTGGTEDTLVIQDGSGSIRIKRTPPGRGPGDAGGEEQKGARAEAAARDSGGRVGDGSNLKLSWSQFESTFGEKELREQRDAYLEQRRTQSRGGQREENWRKFRAAVENFVDKVKPGNQTALNAASSPFAAYLAEMHRSIHREFAMRFLPSLPVVGGAFADPTLVTRLEIIVNHDGSLHEVGVVKTSGFTPFDYGAWNAVTRAAPFPEPPKRILSGDGRVYMRWDFYSNERQCGTFNAEPYILPNPGGEPKKPGPMHDRGTTIPPDGKLGVVPSSPATLRTARLGL
ncbi:MAG TPA: TonB family protein [Polyangiales bacterium]|nr:TonB family protein [Polyangiales bacterium]